MAVSTSAQAQGKSLTDAEVDEAIEKIKKYFYESQDESGAWFGSYHQGAAAAASKNDWGPTAMALLALIVSGESPQHPDIAKGLEVLAEAEFHGVYALSMRAHVWSYLPQGVYGGILLKDADRMLRSSYGQSRFDYPLADPNSSAGHAGDRIDNSTTQYGILAMWQASKRGIDVPPGFWADAVDSFSSLQSDLDGGWAYEDNRVTSQSMTLAGLTVMYVAQQELYRAEDKPNAAVTSSINKGLDYLMNHFDPNVKVHGGKEYMWYGYERVGLASGRKYFGKHDWFQTIAKKIVAKNGRYGGMVHTAAFDLMFLARGRVPVWITKLEIPNFAWNNRPNDVYFLNRYISEYREHEVNWQVVGIDTSEPEEWISAPVIWISSDQQLKLSDEYIAKIKRYLDLGGTLIVNPESDSSSFRSSVEKMAEKMYPNLRFESPGRDHPMASLLEGDPRGSRKPSFRILSNGARALIVLPDDDWGMTFQADKNPNPDTNEHWKHITNIYGVVTDRGELVPRLSSPMVARSGRGSVGTIKVVIPQWMDEAGELPEHDVYKVMRNYMHNETGFELDVQQIPMSEVGAANPALLHLTGVNEIKLDPAEVQSIDAFIKAGGTVLIENLGGTGKFAESVRSQLEGVLPGAEEKVSTRADIITGRNLPDGAKSNRRLVFRRLVLERSNPDARLLLRGYIRGERMPVLLSYEDLSLGMLGVRQYGINGYGVETSRNLMLNILLEAHKSRSGGN